MSSKEGNAETTTCSTDGHNNVELAKTENTPVTEAATGVFAPGLTVPGGIASVLSRTETTIKKNPYEKKSQNNTTVTKPSAKVWSRTETTTLKNPYAKKTQNKTKPSAKVGSLTETTSTLKNPYAKKTQNKTNMSKPSAKVALELVAKKVAPSTTGPPSSLGTNTRRTTSTTIKNPYPKTIRNKTTAAPPNVPPEGTTPVPAGALAATRRVTMENPYHKSKGNITFGTKGPIDCPKCQNKITATIDLLSAKQTWVYGDRKQSKYEVVNCHDCGDGFDLKIRCPGCSNQVLLVWRLLYDNKINNQSALPCRVKDNKTRRRVDAILNCPSRMCGRQLRAILELDNLQYRRTRNTAPKPTGRGNITSYLSGPPPEKKKKTTRFNSEFPGYFVTDTKRYRCGEDIRHRCPACMRKLIFSWGAKTELLKFDRIVPDPIFSWGPRLSLVKVDGEVPDPHVQSMDQAKGDVTGENPGSFNLPEDEDEE
jgi:hypothetical protein